MTNQHPITPPPPELVEKWYDAIDNSSTSWKQELANAAAQWGADQELEACVEYLVRCAQWEPEDVEELRAARRPKPPSLKEQALQEVDALEEMGTCNTDTIRRALEALPDA
jgi:hypothetical protein